MKYNVPLEIKENDSLSIILSHIKPNSTVLEFGCANGRMTRYMKEHLDCKVYIVEYEKDAYEEAIIYAECGICSDIMEFEWLTAFNIKFDYIVFADVLEHLSNPQKVIAYTKGLLKDQGSLLVSVPNIGHNDIIKKLIDERFDYTEIGLLDDTHIHFFAASNLQDFFESCGYGISDMQYVTIPSGDTEQFLEQDYSISNSLKNILSERKSGEIYQFIIIAKKQLNEKKVTENSLPLPYIISKVYVDTGNGFNEQEVVKVKAYAQGAGKYILKENIHLPQKIYKCRFDLVEEQECCVVVNDIVANSMTIQPVYSSNIMTSHGVFLLGNDPLFEVSCGHEMFDDLQCHIEFILTSDCYIKQLTDSLLEIQDKYLATKEKLDIATGTIEETKSVYLELETIRKKSDEAEKLTEKLQSKILKCEDEKIELANKMAEMKETLSSIIDEKDSAIQEKDSAIEEKDSVIGELTLQISEMEIDYKKLIADCNAAIQLREREIIVTNSKVQNVGRKLDFAEMEIANWKLKYSEALEHIHLMENTFSWRITKGLRYIRRKMLK